MPGSRSSTATAASPRTGVTVSFVATDEAGHVWYFDVAGAFTSHRGGMRRTEAVWKALGRAAALAAARGARPVGTDPDAAPPPGREVPLVFLTTHLPRRPSEGDTTLRAAGPSLFFDAVEMLSADGLRRLGSYAAGDSVARPGFWSESELHAGEPGDDPVT